MDSSQVNSGGSTNIGDWLSPNSIMTGVVIVGGAWLVNKILFSETPTAKPRKWVIQPLQKREDQRKRLFSNEDQLGKKLQKNLERANTEPNLTANMVIVDEPKELNLSEVKLLEAVIQKNTDLVGLRSCAVTTQGRSEKPNEDRHCSGQLSLAVNSGNPQPLSYMAVMDGHGGAGSSTFIAENLPSTLEKMFAHHTSSGLSDCAIANALTQAVVELSDELKTLELKPGKLDPSGSTLNLVIVLDGRIWTANVGDSRAILMDGEGKLTQLSEDAKTSDEYHLRSARKHGARVEMDHHAGVTRVNDVAMGRSIGAYKGCYHCTSRPKLTVVDCPKEFYIIQGSDGVWDGMSSKELEAALSKLDCPLEELPGRIAGASFDRGCHDHITAVVTTSSNN